MKTVIICLICLTGIFTFVELHESSKNEQQLNIGSLADRKSSVNPITLDQTKLKNETPEDIVVHTIQRTSKVSSKKENVKAQVSINVVAEQEILNSTTNENLEPIKNELLKNEITMEQFSVDNTVKSSNVVQQEASIQTDGMKVLSAKKEKIETESALILDEQQKEKENISVNLNENSGQSINIENIEPQVLENKSETSFWKNQNSNTKSEESFPIVSVHTENTQSDLSVDDNDPIITSVGVDNEIPVNNTVASINNIDIPVIESINIENQLENNTTTTSDQKENIQTEINDIYTDQTIKIDENEKLFEEALLSNMKGNHQYAIDLYEKLLDENPDHKEALYNLAMSKIELNNIKEGCILLNKSLKKGVTQAKDMIYQYCRW